MPEKPQTEQEEVEQKPGPIPWPRIVVTGLLVLLALGSVEVAVMGPTDLNDNKSYRLDALKLFLTGLAGYGAAVTVWLALRRQQHFEQHSWRQRDLELRKQVSADVDARSRRALDLYSAAADQVASEQAPVRLAGLYSFERMGTEYPEYRQTILDVFCAYLRMERVGATSSSPDPEQEVRNTVQLLLVRNLKLDQNGEPRWGEGLRTNLSGAKLKDFDAKGARFDEALFEGTTFEGRTGFDGAMFHKKARFAGSTFNGMTSFSQTKFHASATFEQCRFYGLSTSFGGAVFSGRAATSFREASFLASHTKFRRTKFQSASATSFNQAVFERVGFERALFEGRVTSFVRAVFQQGSEPFMKAKFSGKVVVSSAEQWAATARGAHVLGAVEEVQVGVEPEDEEEELAESPGED